MTELENMDDKIIKGCLQDAYGYSDGQLLKELEEAEKADDIPEFDGAEARIFRKLMEREKAEEESEAGATPVIHINGKMDGTGENEEKVKGSGKKSRFRKRKIIAVVALAAAFAGVLGISAIGGKNYFFRQRRTETTNQLVINNDANLAVTQDLDRAYAEIGDQLEIPVMRLGYIPEKLDYSYLAIAGDQALICFNYGNNMVTFLQMTKEKGASVGVDSDRKQNAKVFNNWLNRDIEYYEKACEDGENEFEATITIKNTVYFISGKMEEEELQELLKNLYLF